jgi:TatD DNase family protein
MFDTHCHLDVSEFAADRASVLAKARANGVSHVLVPAIDAASFAGIRSLCQRDAQLHAAYGLHPLYISRHRPDDLTALAAALRAGGACAVGEIGLDFYPGAPDENSQQDYFQAQLRLAREFELPVVLHARRAVEAVSLGLKKFGVTRGVIHSFAGSLQQARQLIARGLLLGFGGPITYPGAHKLRALVRQLPIESMVIETDAPDQPLCGFQGARNEPAQLPRVLTTLAELRASTPAEIERHTDANAARLFGLI